MDSSHHPTLRLVGRNDELLVAIDSRSWHVLDEPDLFPDGAMLRQAFGVTWAKGLFREPPQGILKRIAAAKFLQVCQKVWEALLRDQELLSYSYQYELEREKGIRHGGGQSGGFTVRGMDPFITTSPKGYCTLRLRSRAAPDASKRGEVTEIIDLRREKKIQTDDAGCLKIHRRRMAVDWYREMPRILSFGESQGADEIEIRLYEEKSER